MLVDNDLFPFGTFFAILAIGPFDVELDNAEPQMIKCKTEFIEPSISYSPYEVKVTCLLLCTFGHHGKPVHI